ncbi:MAG TPA: kelch repeat-containing protein [Thermoleophilaceae bacterium]|nr:kelch repeat-containing protein [Thermoleophilaceae bacterium]
MLRAATTGLLAILVLAAPASAAPRWSEVGSRSGPSARTDHALAATSSRAVWLLGGRTGSGRALADLWRLDPRRGRWTRIRPRGSSPPARFGLNLLAEPGGTLLAFGGQAGSRFFGDTWRFTPRTRRWRRVASGGPAPRYGAGAAIDPATGRAYVTHGFTFRGRFDDTWALTGGAFRDISPAARPLERCLVQAAFHEGGLFLFGGQSNPRPFLGDLWRLDTASGRWEELRPRSRPSPRNLYAAAQRGRDWLIHGGAGARGEEGDLWRLDLGRAGFTRVRSGRRGPGARSAHAATFAGRDLVVFGGSRGGRARRDTWVLRGL